MPELSRFYGIIIRMYCEFGPHHTPHFTAYHGDDQAVYRLDPMQSPVASHGGRLDWWRRGPSCGSRS